jgi:hypothetical protein
VDRALSLLAPGLGREEFGSAQIGTLPVAATTWDTARVGLPARPVAVEGAFEDFPEPGREVVDR